MRRAVVLGALLLTTACNGSDLFGPSADDVVIESETLVPSVVSGRFCAVRTVLRNDSDESANVTLRWRAFNAAGFQIGDALDFIGGIVPRGRTISTSAFFGAAITSCSQIARFERFEFTVRFL